MYLFYYIYNCSFFPLDPGLVGKTLTIDGTDLKVEKWVPSTVSVLETDKSEYFSAYHFSEIDIRNGYIAVD